MIRWTTREWTSNFLCFTGIGVASAPWESHNTITVGNNAPIVRARGIITFYKVKNVSKHPIVVRRFNIPLTSGPVIGLDDTPDPSPVKWKCVSGNLQVQVNEQLRSIWNEPLSTRAYERIKGKLEDLNLSHGVDHILETFGSLFDSIKSKPTIAQGATDAFYDNDTLAITIPMYLDEITHRLKTMLREECYFIEKMTKNFLTFSQPRDFELFSIN